MDSEEQEVSAFAWRTWPGYVLGGYVLGCGGAAILAARIGPAGWAVLTRPALGLLGVLAGLMLWLRDPWWKTLLQVWLVAQLLQVSVDPSGFLTRQPGLFLGYTWLNEVIWEGERVTRWQSLGVNYVAVLLLIWTRLILAKRWFADVPAGRWLSRVWEVLRLLFILGLLGSVAYLGVRWGRPFYTTNALLVIDCPLPGADVYAKERRLGSTPLVVTSEKLVEWGLSKAADETKCRLGPGPIEAGPWLAGAGAGVELLLKAPDWCAERYLGMNTPWGRRTVSELGPQVLSGTWSHPLVCRSQAGLVLDEPILVPSVCRPAQPVLFTVTLRRHPPEPAWGSPPVRVEGGYAQLAVVFWPTLARVATYSTTNIPLPSAWGHLEAGQSLTHDFTCLAPALPGLYQVAIHYRLSEGANRPTRAGSERVRTYGLLQVSPPPPTPGRR